MNYRKSAQQANFVRRILFCILTIVVLEGAIRKWAIHDATAPLMVLRDALVLFSIAKGIAEGWYHFRRPEEVLLAVWTVLVVGWNIIQTITEIQPLALCILGIRSWVLYLWLSLLCYRSLRWVDIEALLKWTAISVIPMSALATAQHFLPASHPLNKEAEDGAFVFVVTADIVRTTGTFSFTLGYSQYMAFCAAPVLAVIVGELAALKGRTLRAIVVLSYLVGVAVSGSRTCILAVATSSIFLVVGLFAQGTHVSRKRLIAVFAMFMFGLVFVPILLPRAIEATTDRFRGAAEGEDTAARILVMAFGESESWKAVDSIGSGIGYGNNAAASLSGRGEARLAFLGETESDRVLGGGGLLGALFILLKYMIAIFGILNSLVLCRRKRLVLPLLLWAFVATEFVTAQITAQLTAHAFCWLGLGIALAALERSRLGREHEQRQWRARPISQ